MIWDWLTRWAHRSYAEVRWNERPSWNEVTFDDSLHRAGELAAETRAVTIEAA